jgi:hypothetical protein
LEQLEDNEQYPKIRTSTTKDYSAPTPQDNKPPEERKELPDMCPWQPQVRYMHKWVLATQIEDEMALITIAKASE